jgi:GST-like protein
MKIEYAIDRFAMEVKRQMDVLDTRLAKHEYIAGSELTIADFAIYPWYGALARGLLYSSEEFLQVQDYENVMRWTQQIGARPAVKRGQLVNRTWDDKGLAERHSAADFDKR